MKKNTVFLKSQNWLQSHKQFLSSISKGMKMLFFTVWLPWKYLKKLNLWKILNHTKANKPVLDLLPNGSKSRLINMIISGLGDCQETMTAGFKGELSIILGSQQP